MEIETRTSDEHAAVVTLANLYGGDVPGYPFELKVQITCSLHSKNGFTCTTEIENIGKNPAPVGDGWHPYFSLGGKVDDMLLKIPAEHQTEVDSRMIPTGKKLPVGGFETPTLIGDTLFDTGFSLPDNDTIAVTEIHYAEKNVVLEVWQETGKGKYNYLQIYTPPSRTSIAVEPMTCNIDAFNNGEGLIVLYPGDSLKAGYGVKLRQ
jgi:aldose 1-epimerase